MSYTTLITDIINFTAHDEIATSQADTLLRVGQKKVFRDVRVREMETTLNVTINSGVAAIPSDFLGLKSARLNGSPDKPLIIQSDEYIYRYYPNRSSDSKPDFIAVEAENFIFGPFPDTTYTLEGMYYARPASLSSSNTTAAYFTDDGEDLLLFASLTYAESYLKNDPRIGIWASFYDSALSDVKKEKKRERFGGGPLRTKES